MKRDHKIAWVSALLIVLAIMFSSCSRRNYCYGEWDKRPKGWAFAGK